jgi:hypothetical protein
MAGKPDFAPAHLSYACFVGQSLSTPPSLPPLMPIASEFGQAFKPIHFSNFSNFPDFSNLSTFQTRLRACTPIPRTLRLANPFHLSDLLTFQTIKKLTPVSIVKKYRRCHAGPVGDKANPVRLIAGGKLVVHITVGRNLDCLVCCPFLASYEVHLKGERHFLAGFIFEMQHFLIKAVHQIGIGRLVLLHISFVPWSSPTGWLAE